MRPVPTHRPVKITSLSQARLYLKLAYVTGNYSFLDPVIDYFAENTEGCPIAEYLSIARTYLKHGKIDKARTMIKEIEDFIFGGCKECGGGGDGGAEVHEGEHKGALSDST